jgi:hypothetical protein
MLKAGASFVKTYVGSKTNGTDSCKLNMWSVFVKVELSVSIMANLGLF